MSNQRTRNLRRRKATEQHQHCFYCGFPMWQEKPDAFARQFGISLKEAKRFHCTAEHLLARQDGGTSSVDNIVAACWSCNSKRHQKRAVIPAPDRYRQLVQKRIGQLAWHPPQLHKLLSAPDAALTL